MIRKSDLLDSMLHECTVAQHLYGKLTPESLSYRPSPEQRSTLELLRYLAVIGISGLTCMAANDWKRAGEFTARTAGMPGDQFVEAMDRQKAELIAWFEGASEFQLASEQAPLPGGATQPLAVAIMNGPLKWLTAYKLQLFLYAKATGVHDIGTPNVWRGVDRRAPVPQPTID